MTLYRPITQPVQAWCYLRDSDMPVWVSMCCSINDHGRFVLDRPSGRQLVNPGEWLVRTLDGEIMWMPDDEFRKEYEIA